MMSVEWTADDLVFSRRLDTDHQRLFDQLEKVRQALEDGSAASRLGLRLWRLSKDLSTHFASEERLMREFRYPALQWHQSQHQAGRNKMGRLVGAIRGQSAESQAAALQELARWLKDHVHLADRMFAAHLRNGRRERLVS